jgi:outer membrane protein OmpA-like peptidoglycan-associated protein
MKILIFGFIVFSTWSSMATYIYVCKIKGLCNKHTLTLIDAASHENVIAGDKIRKPAVREDAVIPINLITYFAFDKSDFNSDTAAENYFDKSNMYLNENSQAMISITGHTDAIGSNVYNNALGYRRAKSMRHYFESMGIPANKIIIDSKGEKEPADDNKTEMGRANNRRTEITLKK